MSGTPCPFIKWTGFANGAIAPSGSLLFVYQAGTSTKATTYTSASLGTPNANPVVLNSAGQADVWLDPTQSYKFVLAPSTDTDPPTSPYWTEDNVSAIPQGSTNLDTSGTAGENLTVLNCVFLSDGTGGKTSGRWYNCDPGADATSSYPDTIGFVLSTVNTGSSGSIRVAGIVTGLAGLTSGATYYVSTTGAISSSAGARSRRVGVALSTTSLLLSPWLLPTPATSTQGGIVTAGTQTIAGDKTLSGTTVVSGQFQATSATAGSFTTPPIGLAQFSKTASTFTKNNNTTPADVTGIAITVGASQTWVWEVVLFANSAAAADWRLQYTGPAAFTLLWWGFMGSTDNGGQSAAQVFASPVEVTSSGATEIIIGKGLIVNGANAGTIQLQAAQWAGTVSDSQIFTGSFITGWRIA